MNFFKSSPRVCLLLIVVILSLFHPVHVPASDHGKNNFEYAKAFINKGMFPEAVGVYQEIIINSLDADTRARALFFSGSVYEVYLDQPEAALRCYKEVASLSPETTSAPDALFNSGRLLYKNDNYEKACQVFKQFLNKHPKSMRCPSALAWIETAEGKMVASPPAKKHAKQHVSDLASLIRVLIKKNSHRLIFNASGNIQLSKPGTDEVLFYGQGPVVLSVKRGALALNNVITPATQCSIISDTGFLTVGGKRYRGRFNVSLNKSGLSAINLLHIEDYLYGVVPKEMSWLWSEQALMAQAIASRTYALYIRDKQPGSKRYDLQATTDSQVYGGVDAEKIQTTNAVDKTRGKVMTFNEKLIISYFHANSGGHTESSLNVWGVDLPYLQSVSDSFSTIFPESVWEYFLSYKELRNTFKKSLPHMGKINTLKLEEKSESGRIKSFLLITDKGDVRLTGNNFRLLIGPTFLKSTIFKIQPEKKGILFKGSGYGHGAGMSQWGAHRMAKAGYPCNSILKHYYQNIKIKQISYITPGLHKKI